MSHFSPSVLTRLSTSATAFPVFSLSAIRSPLPLPLPLLPLPLPLPRRCFSLSSFNEKRRKGGCSKWKRGGLIPTTIYTGFKGQAPIPKPLYDFQSGDRNLGYDPVSPHTPQSKFRAVDTSTLDPMVRRILSAELSDVWDLRKYHQETVMDKVQRYPGDVDSIEVRITQMTFRWKNLHGAFKHNKHSRKKLLPVLSYIERERYELLMKLRLSDYDKFVWLCDILQIDFRLRPEVRIELTDKEKILMEAQREADAIKEDKLLEYKKFLEKERDDFERVKKETIEKLRRDLAQFGFEEKEEGRRDETLSDAGR